MGLDVKTSCEATFSGVKVRERSTKWFKNIPKGKMDGFERN